MAINIFATYRTGENRVTASILAVLRTLSLSRTERLLGALMEQSEFELVQFENQPSQGGAGVPDARIWSSCHLLLETKIARSAVRAPQLRTHLERFNEAHADIERLLVLTPDHVRPKAIDAVQDVRVAWASFGSLDQAIDDLLADPTEVVSEREAFLLRELQAMFLAEGLIRIPGLAVIVPARTAWPQYRETHTYICQPNRTFKSVEHLGFYSFGEIHPVVPRILEVHEEVQIDPRKHHGRLAEIMEKAIEEGWQTRGVLRKVMVLSAPDDDRTVRLERPIFNDLVSKNGQTAAFTQNQRYVTLELLRKATRTSDLVQE